MAGSRQHLTRSFMRACLRCLTLVDTNVLLHVPVAVVAVLWLVVVLLLLLLPLCTKKLKKHERKYKKSVESKEKLERSSK